MFRQSKQVFDRLRTPYFVFTRLRGFHRFCNGHIWFVPSMDLIFQNLSPEYKLDSKTNRFDDEN
jgi:hypothetical protein